MTNTPRPVKRKIKNHNLQTPLILGESQTTFLKELILEYTKWQDFSVKCLQLQMSTRFNRNPPKGTIPCLGPSVMLGQATWVLPIGQRCVFLQLPWVLASGSAARSPPRNCHQPKRAAEPMVTAHAQGQSTPNYCWTWKYHRPTAKTPKVHPAPKLLVRLHSIVIVPELNFSLQPFGFPQSSIACPTTPPARTSKYQVSFQGTQPKTVGKTGLSK